jgi:hypothetical protein
VSRLEPPALADVLLAIWVFLGLPSHALAYFIGREVTRLREVRRLDRLEAERMRAEGYPPPGPPTA